MFLLAELWTIQMNQSSLYFNKIKLFSTLLHNTKLHALFIKWSLIADFFAAFITAFARYVIFDTPMNVLLDSDLKMTRCLTNVDPVTGIIKFVYNTTFVNVWHWVLYFETYHRLGYKNCSGFYCEISWFRDWFHFVHNWVGCITCVRKF